MSKTFNRTDLPETINYNNKVFKLSISKSNQLDIENKRSILTEKNIVIVNVMSKNLRGKLDLHGKPYKPSKWVFVPIDEK